MPKWPEIFWKSPTPMKVFGCLLSLLIIVVLTIIMVFSHPRLPEWYRRGLTTEANEIKETDGPYVIIRKLIPDYSKRNHFSRAGLGSSLAREPESAAE
jgi:hypothetical protein